MQILPINILDVSYIIHLSLTFFFLLYGDVGNANRKDIANNDILEKCLPAADFEGCVRVLRKIKQNKIKDSKLKTIDILGKKKIPGWKIIENHSRNEVLYINERGVEKVMVRGVFGRYITYDYVKRYYVEPREATPGRYGEWIPGETVCKREDNEEKCTTKPATRPWYPGRTAVPGYVDQISTFVVIDCFDRTGKWSTGDLRWRRIRGGHAENIANNYCSRIEDLPESLITKYEKGTPTDDDFRAISRLKSKKKKILTIN